MVDQTLTGQDKKYLFLAEGYLPLGGYPSSCVYNTTLYLFSCFCYTHIMNGNIITLRRIVQSSLQTTGVLRYNITYIPKLNAYRITLVGSKQGISGQVIGRLLESLSSNGFVVWVRVSKMPLLNVIYIYATPKVSSV